ncbi:hypothetical protein WCP94_001553 [Bilophila wadsworthia]
MICGGRGREPFWRRASLPLSPHPHPSPSQDFCKRGGPREGHSDTPFFEKQFPGGSVAAS